MLTVKDTTTSIGEQCVYCVRTQRPASKVKWRCKWVAATRNWVLVVGTRTRTGPRDWDAYGRNEEESGGLACAPRDRPMGGGVVPGRVFAGWMSPAAVAIPLSPFVFAHCVQTAWNNTAPFSFSLTKVLAYIERKFGYL